MNTTDREPIRYAPLFWVAVILFIVNDFWWMLINSPIVFYLTDYVFRIALLVLIYIWMRANGIRWRALPLVLRLTSTAAHDSGRSDRGPRVGRIVVWTLVAVSSFVRAVR